VSGEPSFGDEVPLEVGPRGTVGFEVFSFVSVFLSGGVLQRPDEPAHSVSPELAIGVAFF
jgi:hypothetical protein